MLMNSKQIKSYHVKTDLKSYNIQCMLSLIYSSVQRQQNTSFNSKQFCFFVHFLQFKFFLKQYRLCHFTRNKMIIIVVMLVSLRFWPKKMPEYWSLFTYLIKNRVNKHIKQNKESILCGGYAFQFYPCSNYI